MRHILIARRHPPHRVADVVGDEKCTRFVKRQPHWAAARLAAFKVPAQMRISQDLLPRNETGKLIKSALRRLFGA